MNLSGSRSPTADREDRERAVVESCRPVSNYQDTDVIACAALLSSQSFLKITPMRDQPEILNTRKSLIAFLRYCKQRTDTFGLFLS